MATQDIPQYALILQTHIDRLNEQISKANKALFDIGKTTVDDNITIADILPAIYDALGDKPAVYVENVPEQVQFLIQEAFAVRQVIDNLTQRLIAKVDELQNHIDIYNQYKKTQSQQAPTLWDKVSNLF